MPGRSRPGCSPAVRCCTRTWTARRCTRSLQQSLRSESGRSPQQSAGSWGESRNIITFTVAELFKNTLFVCKPQDQIIKIIKLFFLQERYSYLVSFNRVKGKRQYTPRFVWDWYVPTSELGSLIFDIFPAIVDNCTYLAL